MQSPMIKRDDQRSSMFGRASYKKKRQRNKTLNMLMNEHIMKTKQMRVKLIHETFFVVAT